MNKHTPGPWWRDDDGFIAAGADESYTTIADPHCSDIDIGEREANASLIAAAPDLLAALEYIMNWSPEDWSAETAQGMALAAIAKAKGGADAARAAVARAKGEG